MRKAWYKRLRWENVILSFVVLLGFITIILAFFFQSQYSITYMEYHMKPNDSLTSVIQDSNTHYPVMWDVRDLVALAEDRNQLDNSNQLDVGQVVYIPVVERGN